MHTAHKRNTAVKNDKTSHLDRLSILVPVKVLKGVRNERSQRRGVALWFKLQVGIRLCVNCNPVPISFFPKARTDEKSQTYWLGTLHTATGHALLNAHLPLQRAGWVADLKDIFIYVFSRTVCLLHIYALQVHPLVLRLHKCYFNQQGNTGNFTGEK